MEGSNYAGSDDSGAAVTAGVNYESAVITHSPTHRRILSDYLCFLADVGFDNAFQSKTETVMHAFMNQTEAVINSGAKDGQTLPDDDLCAPIRKKEF